MDSLPYWLQMLLGYLFTIGIEAPILLVGLSGPHPWRRRLFAGVWLTACTYPLLWLTLPVFLPLEQNRGLYLAVGETLVPIAEAALFWAVFDRKARLSRLNVLQDMLVIVLANLASFGLGELAHHLMRP